MAENDYVPFAIGSGANVLTAAAYANLPDRQAGFQSGTARSQYLNTVWRQASEIASMIGAFIALRGYDALDDGNQSELLNNFESAFNAQVFTQIPQPGTGLAGGQQFFGWQPASAATHILTANFQAPATGIVLAFSTWNTSPANGNVSNTVQINSQAGAADSIAGASTSITELKVNKNDAVSIVSTITTSGALTFGGSQYLNYIFIPA